MTPTLRTLLAAGTLALPGLLHPAAARADDALGLYVGGAVGQGSLASNDWWKGTVSATATGFRENHAAWAARLGLRPLSVLALEVEYFDSGHARTSYPPSGNVSASVDVQMKGAGAYALVYLPVPLLDVYGKVGTARVQTHTTATVGCGVAACVGGSNQVVTTGSRAETGLAWGAGLGAKLGPVSVRGEYLRLAALSAHPSLVTVGASWSF